MSEPAEFDFEMPEMREFFSRALANEPSKRFASADEMKQGLLKLSEPRMIVQT